MTPEEAYGFCREVAQREAKNFYSAFRVLPRAKSDAMCAVYAFMRRADDLADDESMTLPARRGAMAAWLANGGRRGLRGARTDPVFVALGDTQRRFGIADALLEDLVRGTAWILKKRAAAVDLGRGLQGYETFADLYRYCYLVASVVGLVCITDFWVHRPAAELLAEQTGVAFQLTNILRDVKEDAERKRIYLPQDMMREFGVTNDDVLAVAGGRVAGCANAGYDWGAFGAGAWEFYEAAEKLLPLIDADSRAALWVLVEDL